MKLPSLPFGGLCVGSPLPPWPAAYCSAAATVSPPPPKPTKQPPWYPGETNAASDSSAVTAKADCTGAAAGSVKPTGAKPAWGPNIKPEMQAVIEQLMSFNNKPLPELTAAQARKQPSPADAAMKQMRASNIPTPPMNCDTMPAKTLMAGVNARIYTPKRWYGPVPRYSYTYHGGGWVIANLTTRTQLRHASPV